MRPSPIKNILSKNLVLPFRKGRRFIFTYHDVSESTSIQHSKNYSTTPEKFKEQILFLSNLFEWVDLDSITREEPFKNNVATIMFDDGFKSIEKNALPFLKKNKIPFSIFVNQCAVKFNRLWVSDLQMNREKFNIDFHTHVNLKSLSSHNSFKLFEEDPAFNNQLHDLNLQKYTGKQIFLGEKDLLKLSQQHVLIGNHGAFHTNLAMCNEQALHAEIADNKRFIENIINSEVKHYAIAFGKKEHYSKKIIDIIKNAGHKFIYNTNPVSFSSLKNKVLLPRIGITGQSPKEIMFYVNRQFLKKINL